MIGRLASDLRADFTGGRPAFAQRRENSVAWTTGGFVNPDAMQPSPAVSLHPYFKAHPGKIDAFRALFPKFVEKTAPEKGCLHYGFSVNGDEVFCREAYRSAEDVLTHLENVNALLQEALNLSDLTRIEVHGPAEELDKLRLPMAALSPAFFVYEAGLDKP